MYKKIDLDKIIIYDIETSINCIILCFLDFSTKLKKEFVIYDNIKYADQTVELYKFLKSCVKNNYTLFGFNVLGFDSQVLHYFYNECENEDYPLYNNNSKYIISTLYSKAQDVIMSRGDYTQIVPEYRLFIPHIDIFKQLHYDRPAKATSLKWVEFSMQRKVIKEMPYSHNYQLSLDEVNEMLLYCWEDVHATLEFFEKNKFETELRLKLSNEYDINLVNASETKLGKSILTKYLCEGMNITPTELKDLKTIRKNILFKDVIFPYITFLTDELNNILTELKSVNLDVNPHSKSSFSYDFNYNGIHTYLGLGGIHACVKEGVYEPKDDEVMLDYDITSMYPQIAIQNKLKPEHLGNIFTEIYENLFIERQKYDKKDPRNYILKICLNSVYGLSGEINSFLYDRKYQLSTTINGQLLILMFVEALYKGIPEIKILQKNTDGITFILKKEYLPILDKIRVWWENKTKLSFEYVEYNKMIIKDVNNYIAQYTNGSLKKKGLFETEMPYHKNPSALIIPKAIENYFINNLTIEETINNENNSIFDYCYGVKKKNNFELNLITFYDNVEIIREQQRVCRFIASNNNENSGKLFKDFNDGRRVGILVDTFVEPLDVIDKEEVKHYNINYNYYISQAKKIIESIKPTVLQQTLF